MEDFVAAGALLACLTGGAGYALLSRRSVWDRAGTILALLTAVATVWAALAVGIAGEPGDPMDLAFLAVPGLAAAGALLARGRPQAMKRAMLAAAIAQTGATALLAARAEAAPAALAYSLVIAALYGLSAGLFSRAA